jgi:hypothetical protein
MKYFFSPFANISFIQQKTERISFRDAKSLTFVVDEVLPGNAHA